MPSPVTTGKGSSANKKRKRRATPEGDFNTESSEEAVSTDDDETSVDSPTPAAKQSRISYTRVAKPQEGAYTSFDGGDSEDDNRTIGIGGPATDWADVMKKRLSIRAQLDDSDEKSDPDWLQSDNDETANSKTRSRFGLCFGSRVADRSRRG